MPSTTLEEYRRKRDFKQTPEPSGDPATACGRRGLCLGATAPRFTLLCSETSGHTHAFRLQARARRRPALVGGAAGSEPRSREEAPRRPDRGSPHRLRRVRGRDPIGIRRGHRDALGHRHVRMGEGVRSRLRSIPAEGRHQVPPQGHQALGRVRPRPHRRTRAAIRGQQRRRQELADAQETRCLGRRGVRGDRPRCFRQDRQKPGGDRQRRRRRPARDASRRASTRCPGPPPNRSVAGPGPAHGAASDARNVRRSPVLP